MSVTAAPAVVDAVVAEVDAGLEATEVVLPTVVDGEEAVVPLAEALTDVVALLAVGSLTAAPAVVAGPVPLALAG